MVGSYCTQAHRRPLCVRQMSALEANFEGLVHALVPLGGLSPPSRAQVLNQAEIVRFRRGDTVFREGDRDPYTLYLLEGRLQMLSGGQTIHRVTGGSADAAHALAQLQPRKLSARAESEVAILRVDRDLLERIVAADGADGYCAIQVEDIDAADDGDWMTRMLQSKLFAHLPASNIHRIFSLLEEIEVRQSDVVVKQGDAGDYYYVIVHGRCEVTRSAGPNTPGYRLALIGPGDAFGEEALVAGTRRNATVRMLSDGRLVRLAKEGFVELIQKPLLSGVTFDEGRRLRASEDALWLDVRFPEEHQENGIDGSLNHPLNTLRMHTGRLDGERTYIVYCDTGTRSAVAAFLLAERGFDVHFLEGGLMRYDLLPAAVPDLALSNDETSTPDRAAQRAAAAVPKSHLSAVEQDRAATVAALTVELGSNELRIADAAVPVAASPAPRDPQAEIAAAVLREASALARAEGERAAAQKIEAERQRIAAEMHDARVAAERKAEAKLQIERKRIQAAAAAARRELAEALRLKAEVAEARTAVDAAAAAAQQREAVVAARRRAELERARNEAAAAAAAREAEVAERLRAELERTRAAAAVATAAAVRRATDEAERLKVELERAQAAAAATATAAALRDASETERLKSELEQARAAAVASLAAIAATAVTAATAQREAHAAGRLQAELELERARAEAAAATAAAAAAAERDAGEAQRLTGELERARAEAAAAAAASAQREQAGAERLQAALARARAEAQALAAEVAAREQAEAARLQAELEQARAAAATAAEESARRAVLEAARISAEIDRAKVEAEAAVAEAARRELAEAERIRVEIERAKAEADEAVRQERAAQRERVEQVRAEMAQKLAEEERKLRASYAWQAEELKRLQAQKADAEVRLREEQLRLRAQAEESSVRLAEARQYQKRLEEVQEASAREAEMREQQQLALERRLREELQHEVQSERRKLEQELTRNAVELERARREREAAEAARQAAAVEAQQIIAEFKDAHARKRMQEEAEMRFERERLETDSRRLRLALELAQREKQAALDNQQRIRAELDELEHARKRGATHLDLDIEALSVQARDVARQMEVSERASAEAQAAAVATAGDLAAHQVHEERARADLKLELDHWLHEQDASENTDAQRGILANQRAHLDRIKQSAQTVRAAAKAHDQALIKELAAKLRRGDGD